MIRDYPAHEDLGLDPSADQTEDLRQHKRAAIRDGCNDGDEPRGLRRDRP